MSLTIYEPKIVNIQVAGVTVQARAYRAGDLVNLEFMMNTPLGPVAGKLTTDLQSFEKMAAAAEKHNILPRAQAAIEHYTGKRLVLSR